MFLKGTIVLLLFILTIIIIYRRYISVHENFEPMDTFHNSLATNRNIKILDINRTIKYNKKDVVGFVNSSISYNILSNGKEYTILRYPDFRDENLRHSKSHITKFLTHLNNNYFKPNKNYILDFTGFHGYIDNKVNLWVAIKNKFGRATADEVMCKTYLCPNDYDMFIKDYKPYKKFILKNSFGGARSALKITDSIDEILGHFKSNTSTRFDPEKCEDAVCHSKVKYNIVQKFMEPGMLVNGRKVGFRMFLVIFYVNGTLSTGLYKDAICYYSKGSYDKTSTGADNNVVGSIFKMQKIIKKQKLPDRYSKFFAYTKTPQPKVDYFLDKLREYCKIIVNSVEDKIVFTNRPNVKMFSIYGLDVEYDKNFKPCIFEGNFYFTRFSMNNKYGHLIKELYTDIYYRLGLSKRQINGFWNIQ